LIKWREGDPVGAGEVYLPDTKTRKAYGAACQELWVEPAAHYILGLRTIEQRRSAIREVPDHHRDKVETRVRELWKKVNEAREVICND
tara:strand:+ start:1763 stop:2026 length:264 start_codon:yes stop_codon:yes gene_type:complete